MSCSESPVMYSSPALFNPMSAKFKRKRSPSKEPAISFFKDEEISTVSKRPKLLQIIIPSSLNSGLEDIGETTPDSLFSGSDVDSLFDSIDEENIPIPFHDNHEVALRTGPPISGLFFGPEVLLAPEIADLVVSFCMKTYFSTPFSNQVMLFGRFSPSKPSDSNSASGLPPVLLDLINTLSVLLRPVIPPETYEILFPAKPTMARQAIINLYRPGEGITPHVDLLGRYADGIVGVSFCSGCAMRFDEVDAVEGQAKKRWDVYLPERSIIVLTEDARYKWTHGIEKTERDLVSSDDGKGSWIERGIRMSVTFRWLLPGADIVGEP